MIQKNVLLIAISMLVILGACTPVADDPTKISDLPETEIPENETGNSKQTYEEVLGNVKLAVETEVELKLPGNIPIENGYLTATTTSSQNNYEVHFYVTNVPIPVNDPSLHDAHPYMIVHGTKFESPEAAKAKINYEPIIDGADKVDLGHGITGDNDAGAGSTFLTWHEGRWSFSMRNLNNEIGNKAMIDLAKQIVEKLEGQTLPAPQTIGAGMFDMNSDGAAANSLMWQQKDVVYEVYTADPLVLVDTVTESMEK